MRIIPANPDVADAAPTDTAALTPYDHEHAITYLRLLDANAEGPIGAKWHDSWCTSTPSANRAGPGRLTRVISDAPNG